MPNSLHESHHIFYPSLTPSPPPPSLSLCVCLSSHNTHALVCTEQENVDCPGRQSRKSNESTTKTCRYSLIDQTQPQKIDANRNWKKIIIKITSSRHNRLNRRTHANERTNAYGVRRRRDSRAQRHAKTETPFYAMMLFLCKRRKKECTEEEE